MEKQCGKCNIMKSENDFYTTQRGNRCKECILKVTKEYKRKYRLNPEFKKNEGIKQKERRLRLWQNTLINDSKNRGVEHNITVDDINEIFKKQNGLCFWFKVPLVPSNKLKHPQQPSLDRLDRNKGYTRDNVVLSCYSANIGRNEASMEEWEKFLILLFN